MYENDALKELGCVRLHTIILASISQMAKTPL